MNMLWESITDEMLYFTYLYKCYTFESYKSNESSKKDKTWVEKHLKIISYH